MAPSREKDELVRRLQSRVQEEKNDNRAYNDLARLARDIGAGGLADSLEEIALQESFHEQAVHDWARVIEERYNEVPRPQSPHVRAGDFVVIDRGVDRNWQGWTWNPRTPNVYGPLESQMGRPGYTTQRQARKATQHLLHWSAPQLEASIRAAKEAGWTPR